MISSGGEHVDIEGLDDAGVPQRHRDTFARELVGGGLGCVEHLSHADDAQIGAGAQASGIESVADLVRADMASLGFRPANGGGAVSDLEGVVQHLSNLLIGGGGEDGHAGHLGEQHHVEHAVMARAVVAGDAGTIETEHHGFAMKADIEVDLIDGSGEEGRVHREHWPETAPGHAGCCCHSMLLGDADIEHATGELLGERQQASGVGHGGGDGHEFGSLCALGDQRLGEGGGVAAGLGLRGVMQSLDGIVLGRSVATTLLGHDVDDLRPAGHGDGVRQCRLNGGDVMPIERPGVADTEGLEERCGFPHLADSSLGGVETALGDASDHGKLGEEFLELGLPTHVHRVVADLHQAFAEFGDCRSIGTAVVVEDDDDIASCMSQVVQSFERHATGHCAIADHCDDSTVSDSRGDLRSGEAVGPAQYR